MNKFFVYLFIIFIGILLHTIYPKTSSAQYDDPRYDRIPESMLNRNSHFNLPATVVTIDDYDNFNLGVDFAECHIVTNPQNSLQFIAVWNNLSTSIGGSAYNTSNGHDWTLSPNPPWGVAVRSDVVLAYDSLGNVYLEQLSGSGTFPSGTVVARSNNNGQSWPGVVSGNTGWDKNWITADQTAGPYSNNIYGIMSVLNNNGANIIRSTDRGLTFNHITTLFPEVGLPGSMFCVGPNGNIQGGSVYVVYPSGSSTASNYNFYRSTDGGATYTLMSSQFFSNYIGTFVNTRHSVQNMRTRPYPFITADNSYGPYRGRLYLFYASNNPSGNGNKPDIFCRYSTDWGTTWSSAVIVNDDPNSQNHNQWMPAPWCDKETGRLYIQWMDTRDCPTNDSCLIYASYSTNGGQSFVTNQKISNKKFRINCTTCGGGGTPRYQGDYNGITSNSKTSMLAWTDFRNNNFANYTAYFPDYAMKVNSNNIIIDNNNTATFRTIVPSVKLYTDNTTFTAAVSPTPVNGALTVSFPNGNSLSNYPDSLLVSVHAAPNTTSGAYSVTVTARGSNGTPVHERTVTLTVGTVGVISLNEIPNNFELAQNYPNPFNPITRINYTLKSQTNVKLSVFDAMGKLVSTINKGTDKAGIHFVNFNGSSLSSGVYYYKLETDFFSDTKKMLLIK